MLMNLLLVPDDAATFCEQDEQCLTEKEINWYKIGQ